MTDKGSAMYFSQAALATYQTCPLRFRCRYLDELNWLRAGQQDLHREERVLGVHFHLLAQRYFSKVALPRLVPITPPGPLREWLNRLQQRFPLKQDLTYYPEQELRVVIDGALFTAKYDLLTVYPDGRIFIYDWKTRAAPPGKRARSLQTKVYSLVLCAAAPFGPLRPADITMVFWNPRFPLDEQVWPYNELLYCQDRAELTTLTARIAATPYEDFSGIKPTEDGPVPRECRSCDYAALCFHAGPPGIGGVPLPERPDFSWDDIEEVCYEEA